MVCRQHYLLPTVTLPCIHQWKKIRVSETRERAGQKLVHCRGSVLCMAINLAASIIQYAHKILNWTTWFKIEILLVVVGSCVLVILKSPDTRTNSYS